MLLMKTAVFYDVMPVKALCSVELFVALYQMTW